MRFVVMRCNEMHFHALAIIFFESRAASSLPGAFNVLRASKEPWMAMLGHLHDYSQGHAQLEFSEANLR